MYSDSFIAGIDKYSTEANMQHYCAAWLSLIESSELLLWACIQQTKGLPCPKCSYYTTNLSTDVWECLGEVNKWLVTNDS